MTPSERIAAYIAAVIAEFPEVLNELAQVENEDGGPFREFVERRHGQGWISRPPTAEELREECRAYLAEKKGEPWLGTVH